jgi:hypothetical protein
MWDALKAVGNAAYGLVSSDELPLSVPCGYPPVEPKTTEEKLQLTEQHYQAFLKTLDAPEWSLVSWNDPDASEGGDIRLWTKPQEGRYHYLKATFSLTNVTPKQVYDLVASDQLATRKRFSADIEDLECAERVSPNTQVFRVRYWAPPPVAARDFCFLQSEKTQPDGSIEVYGCSIASDKVPEKDYVRGMSFWGWRLMAVGSSTLVTYFNCSDPRGWTPGFLFSWLKTAAGKELVSLRRCLYGRDVKVEHASLDEAGISEDQIKAETPPA